MSDTAHCLQVINLGCIRQQKSIFVDVSFVLSAGETLLVEGANGSGKSSLLRLLAGLSTPAAGDVQWQQQSIHSLGARYTHQLHYVGHTNGIKLGLTVAENIQFASHLADQSAQAEEAILAQLQLSSQRHTQARFLSAGQKRRLGLAKLFLFPKPLWIVDEPLTALDVETQNVFLSLLEMHLQNGGLCVMSSHQPIALPTARLQTLRLTTC
jgi:heme exporter protein A